MPRQPLEWTFRLAFLWACLEGGVSSMENHHLPSSSSSFESNNPLPFNPNAALPKHSSTFNPDTSLLEPPPPPLFGPQCEEVKIPMCLGMPYNFTRLPNLLHHSTQDNARLAVEQFELLRWTQCSDQLEFFLCSMFAPICAHLEFASEAIPPCRSVCQAARNGCEPLLQRFDISWPASLDCGHLPEYERGVCITPQAIVSPQPSITTPPPTQDKCECQKTPKLRQKVYKRRNFDFVLQGRVQRTDSLGSLTLTTVLVQEVVRSRVMIVPGSDAYLWTNRSCACPPLVPQGEYLVMGWEDVGNSRLLYLEGSIAVPFKKRYVRKIRAWDEQNKNSPPQPSQPFPPHPSLPSHLSLSNNHHPATTPHHSSTPSLYNDMEIESSLVKQDGKLKKRKKKKKKRKRNRLNRRKSKRKGKGED